MLYLELRQRSKKLNKSSAWIFNMHFHHQHCLNCARVLCVSPFSWITIRFFLGFEFEKKHTQNTHYASSLIALLMIEFFSFHLLVKSFLKTNLNWANTLCFAHDCCFTLFHFSVWYLAYWMYFFYIDATTAMSAAATTITTFHCKPISFPCFSLLLRPTTHQAQCCV